MVCSVMLFIFAATSFHSWNGTNRMMEKSIKPMRASMTSSSSESNLSTGRNGQSNLKLLHLGRQRSLPARQAECDKASTKGGSENPHHCSIHNNQRVCWFIPLSASILNESWQQASESNCLFPQQQRSRTQPVHAIGNLQSIGRKGSH